MVIDAISRSPSLVEKVCQKLAGLARRDQQEDDGWLPTERELSTRLGVSRSVVREATKRLEMQGLLEIRQGIGIRVVDMLHKPLTSAIELLLPAQEERLRQLVEVRLMIEPENARLAAERAASAQVRRLQSAHKRLVEAGEAKAAVLADLEFHRIIATASGNQIGGLLLISLSDLLQASLARGYRIVTTESAIKEHAAILRAIEQRDPAGAARAMVKHIHTTRNELGLTPRSSRRRRPSD
ncbi:MAG: FadR family transcriptional regulator [Verrucomicrobia bacterium]|nr:FadR family transcriptional regulator [Verrucomicrobiota bacterium]